MCGLLQQMVADRPWEDGSCGRPFNGRASFPVTNLAGGLDDQDGTRAGSNKDRFQWESSTTIAEPSASRPTVSASGTGCHPRFGGELRSGAGFLCPRPWSQDRERCAQAGVPPEIQFATGAQLAVDLIQEAISEDAGVAQGSICSCGQCQCSGGSWPSFAQHCDDPRSEFFLQVVPREREGSPEPVKTRLKRDRAATA